MPAAYLHGAAKRKSVRTDAMLVKETDINHRIHDKFLKCYYYLKRKTGFTKQAGRASKGSLPNRQFGKLRFVYETNAPNF